MSDNAKRLMGVTGLYRPTAQRLLNALSPHADAKAGASVFDLACFFEVDPVIAARLIRTTLKKNNDES